MADELAPDAAPLTLTLLGRPRPQTILVSLAGLGGLAYVGVVLLGPRVRRLEQAVVALELLHADTRARVFAGEAVTEAELAVQTAARSTDSAPDGASGPVEPQDGRGGPPGTET